MHTALIIYSIGYICAVMFNLYIPLHEYKKITVGDIALSITIAMFSWIILIVEAIIMHDVIVYKKE